MGELVRPRPVNRLHRLGFDTGTDVCTTTGAGGVEVDDDDGALASMLANRAAAACARCSYAQQQQCNQQRGRYDHWYRNVVMRYLM